MILETHYSLYRYNINEPPTHWNTEYKNPQYVSSSRGAKNSIGAYFFYSKYITAVNVGKKAINEFKQSVDGTDRLYITSCNVISEIKLLDLRLSVDSFEPEYMLDKLYENEIDVLTDDFSHLNPSHSLSEIKDSYQSIRQAKLSGKPLNWENESCMKVNSFFCGKSNLLGQCLTDYENRYKFRSLLKAKGFDGYLFVEEIDDPTICLFGVEHLSGPVHQIVEEQL